MLFNQKKSIVVMFIAQLCMTLLLVSGQGHTSVTADFFTTKHLVADQSLPNRHTAIQDGFADILVKLAGQDSILQRPELAPLLQNPRQFVEKFTYSELLNLDQSQTLLTLQFTGDTIERLFFKYKLPLWSKDRPNIMVWLGVDARQGRHILAKGQTSTYQDFSQKLRDAAATRGLSIQLPLLDSQDQETITATDVWSLDMTSVVNASRRYGAQILLLGKVTQSPSGEWFTQWGLEYEGRASWNEDRAQSFELIAANVMAQVAEQLAGIYAVEVGHESTHALTLEIQGVDSLRDYADISTILNSLLPVSHLAVRRAQPGVLIYDVTVEGGERQLMSSLRLQPLLRSMPNTQTFSTQTDAQLTEQAAEATTTVLKYRWLGRDNRSK